MYISFGGNFLLLVVEFAVHPFANFKIPSGEQLDTLIFLKTSQLLDALIILDFRNGTPRAPMGPNDSPVEQVWRSVLQFMYQGAGQYDGVQAAKYKRIQYNMCMYVYVVYTLAYIVI